MAKESFSFALSFSITRGWNTPAKKMPNRAEPWVFVHQQSSPGQRNHWLLILFATVAQRECQSSWCWGRSCNNWDDGEESCYVEANGFSISIKMVCLCVLVMYLYLDFKSMTSSLPYSLRLFSQPFAVWQKKKKTVMNHLNPCFNEPDIHYNCFGSHSKMRGWCSFNNSVNM